MSSHIKIKRVHLLAEWTPGQGGSCPSNQSAGDPGIWEQISVFMGIETNETARRCCKMRLMAFL